VRRSTIDIREERGVRSLHFGSHWIQGAMRIARPYALELDYTRDMMLSLLLRSAARWPRHVLMVGLGSASLAKFLYRHRPRARLTAVEINPDVVAAARQFFKLPEDPARLDIVIGDGVDYVSGAQREFDLILVDGFDADGRAGPLETPRFYLAAGALLSAQGLLVANLLSPKRGIADAVGRVRRAFDERVRTLPRTEAGNTVVIAASGAPVDVALAELRARARILKQDTGLNLLPTIARMRAGSSDGAAHLRF
jgi:spermidine synthase